MNTGERVINNIVVIGSSGALGHAFAAHLARVYPQASVHAFSQKPLTGFSSNVQCHLLNYGDEASIEQAALLAAKNSSIDMVIVATGFLHDQSIQPEKSLKELSTEKFQHLFMANTIVPALMAKHFIPKLTKSSCSIFAALSARVGSISDNKLGGWYAYRASKAALNMFIKTAAIETRRVNKQAIIVGLHPGTVDSVLSKPFQANVADGKLFSPKFSVIKLLSVLDALTLEQTGRCFAWDGQEVEP